MYTCIYMHTYTYTHIHTHFVYLGPLGSVAFIDVTRDSRAMWECVVPCLWKVLPCLCVLEESGTCRASSQTVPWQPRIYGPGRSEAQLLRLLSEEYFTAVWDCAFRLDYVLVSFVVPDWGHHVSVCVVTVVVGSIKTMAFMI